MSYDFIVYTRRDRLPDADALRAALLTAEPAVEIMTAPNLATARGLVPVRMAGRETGFEMRTNAIEPDEIADYQADLESSGEQDDGFLKVLEENDTRITFSANTDDEKTAASVVAASVARLSNGVLSDPQTGVDS